METGLNTKATSGYCYSSAAPANRDDCERVNTLNHVSVATKPLWSRSVMQSQHVWSRADMQSQQVSEDQLKALILDGGLGDDVIYEVDGCVSISGYADLKTLSGNISITGAFFITSCPHLQELSANLLVQYSVIIFDCPRLESLTGSICIGGSFDCHDAKGLKDVSGSLYVDARMSMTHCNHLEDISGTVNVNGKLNLKCCKSLQNLSGNITVHDALNLESCYNLTNLTGTFSVGGNIYLENCTSLNCLPDWITSLGCKASGEERTIDLEGSGLSTVSVDQARAVAAGGMKFSFTQELKAVNQFQEIGLALDFWRETASSAMEIPDLDLGFEDEYDLLDFLKLLTRSADYRDKSFRPVLARRVMEVMTVFMDDQSQKKALEYVSECEEDDHDGAIQVLKKLETLLLPSVTPL